MERGNGWPNGDECKRLMMSVMMVMMEMMEIIEMIKVMEMVVKSHGSKAV